MITTYAGSPRLRIELSIRKSINSSCGRLAKISRAFAAFPMAFTPALVAGSATDIKAYQNGSVGMAVLERWAGGFCNNALHNQALNGNTVEVDVIPSAGTGDGFSSGQLYLLDMDHVNKEIWLECYAGNKATADLAPMSQILRERIVGRPDPAYLSSTAAMSEGKFGSLDDEVAAYAKWGWTFTAGQKPASPAKLDAATLRDDVHDGSETDNAEGQLLQWVRTGQRGFFDDGEAWSRYFKTHYAFRTVGFADDGQYLVVAYAQQKAKRTSQTVSGDPDYYTNWRSTRVDVEAWVGCHFYGAGLCDYYCLTGDIDALEGAKDLGETAWLFCGDDKTFGDNRDSDTLNSYQNAHRDATRRLNVLTRLYEIVRDSASFHRADFQAKMMLRTKYRDPRGFIWCSPVSGNVPFQNPAGWPDSLKQFLTANNITWAQQADSIVVQQAGRQWNVRSQAGNWEQTYAQEALDRWYRVTGDKDARDYVIGFGQHGARDCGGRCGQVPTELDFDFPRKGDMFSKSFDNWDPAHDKCVLADGTPNHSTASGSLAPHNGWSVVYYAGVASLGYRYTGSPDLLRFAYQEWDLGSKRLYYTDHFETPAKQVYTFAYQIPDDGDGVINTNALFYEAVHRSDTIPPAAVTDLAVNRLAGNTGLVFNWSAPSDNNGTVAEYQLKYFKDKQIVAYADYNYARDDSAKVPWWYAVNTTGEPVPQAPGSLERMQMNKVFNLNEAWYAAVCSRDAAGNLSPLSNLVRIDNTVGVEASSGDAAFKNGFVISPNPFYPMTHIRAWLDPNNAGNARIGIYTIAGKRVWQKEIGRNTAKGGSVFVSWDGKDARKTRMPSGVYLVKLIAGDKQTVRKVTLAK
jgi:hypothetical protein